MSAFNKGLSLNGQYIPAKALEITFDSIANAPVADPSSVAYWNTFFDLPTLGTAFASVVVDSNTVKLYGGSGITIKTQLFQANNHLTGFDDKAGCIVATAARAFSNAVGLTNIILPNLVTAAQATFINCTGVAVFSFPKLATIQDTQFIYGCYSVTDISLPVCTALGSSTGDNQNFTAISGLTINLTVPAALMTCNGGNPDGDIATLRANNTVNVITV